jgi:phage portal protein BeeE
MWLDWLGGRVGSLFAARSATNPGNAPVELSRVWFTGRTQAGVHVTPDKALQLATVWACVTYLCRTVGQLPWHVMSPRADGRGADRQMSHPCDWLINVRPCPDYGSFSWRGSMLGTALLWGNAYAEIERDMRGVPVALWPIHPSRVVVRRGGDGGLVYNVTNSGSQPSTSSRSRCSICAGSATARPASR